VLSGLGLHSQAPAVTVMTLGVNPAEVVSASQTPCLSVYGVVPSQGAYHLHSGMTPQVAAVVAEPPEHTDVVVSGDPFLFLQPQAGGVPLPVLAVLAVSVVAVLVPAVAVLAEVSPYMKNSLKQPA